MEACLAARFLVIPSTTLHLSDSEFKGTRGGSNLHLTSVPYKERRPEGIFDVGKQVPPLSRNYVYNYLLDCARRKDLQDGRVAQFFMVQNGLHSIAALGDHLIRLFFYSGCLDEANKAFNNISRPSAFTWSAILSAHANIGEAAITLELHWRMNISGVQGEKHVYLAVLKVCRQTSDLGQGKLVHGRIICDRIQPDVYIGSILVDMYAQCGSLDEACAIFDYLPYRNVVLWNNMIAAYSKYGDSFLAIKCFDKMQFEGIKPDRITLLSILKISGGLGYIEQGRCIHENVMGVELQMDTHIGSTIIDMYAKCGSLEEAQIAFQKLQIRNVVSWGAMIDGYVQHDENMLAIESFERMKREGIKVNRVIYLSILKACGNLENRMLGRKIHAEFIQTEIPFDMMIGSTLVQMYAKCKSLVEAHMVFDELPDCDVISWGILIAAYVHNGMSPLALQLHNFMQQDGVRPNKVIFLSILKACGNVGHMEQGKCIHVEIIRDGLLHNAPVGNTLIDMYAKCGEIETARKLFDQLPNRDIVSWGVLIAGYVQHGKGLLALECYGNMQDELIRPNVIIFSSTLKACETIGDVLQGRCIHVQVIKSGVDSDIVVANTLVDMYAKCGNLEEAYNIFNRLPNRDVISWGTMIGGYVEHGKGLLALECFNEMQREGIEPNVVTFLSIIKACGCIGGVEQGRHVYKQIIETGLQLDGPVGNALIDMYAKCGIMEGARDIFDLVRTQDVVSWSALISGFSQHGNAALVVECFEAMQQNGLRPNDMTFGSVLSACSRAGLVDEGRRYFKCMKEYYDVKPNLFHVNCMVDLLSHAGYFKEAETLLQLTLQPNICGWITLLSGCMVHGNIEQGRSCFDKIHDLNCHFTAGYVLMSNICASAEIEDGSLTMETDIYYG